MSTPINTLKAWFKNGLKPPQEAFWAWMESYWHKTEKIPIENIEDIAEILKGKADVETIAGILSILNTKVDEDKIGEMINQLIADDLSESDIHTYSINRINKLIHFYIEALTFIDDESESGNDVTYSIDKIKALIAESIANLSNYYTKEETENVINAKVATLYKPKGSVYYYADLPTDNEVGDVWNIVNADAENGIKAGDNVVWTESGEWDILAGTVDLSKYYTKEETNVNFFSTNGNDAAKDLFFGTNTAHAITFVSSGVTRAYIAANGNVGIGDDPTNPLTAIQFRYTRANPVVLFVNTFNGNTSGIETAIATNNGAFHPVAKTYDKLILSRGIGNNVWIGSRSFPDVIEDERRVGLVPNSRTGQYGLISKSVYVEGNPNGVTYNGVNIYDPQDFFEVDSKETGNSGITATQLKQSTKELTIAAWKDGKLVPITSDYSKWQAPEFQNGIVNYDVEYQQARYRKIGSRVYIEGLIQGGTTQSNGQTYVLFNLPEGYRPKARQMFAVAQAGGAFGRIDVKSNGDVCGVVYHSGGSTINIEFFID